MTAARIRVILLALTDLLGMAGIWMATAAIYQYFGGEYPLKIYCRLWPVLPLFLCCNGFIRLYHGNFFYPGNALPPVEEIRRLFFSISLTYLLLLSYLLLSRHTHEYSRAVVLISWMISCILIMPLRNLTRILMKKLGVGQIRILIAGAGRTGQQLAEDLDDDFHFGFRVVGFLDDNPNRLANTRFKGMRLGGLKDAIPCAKEAGQIHYLICCLPLQVTQSWLHDYMRYFTHLTIIPDNQIFPISWSYPTNLQGFAGLELRNQLLLPGPRILKSLLEIFLSFCGLLLLWPLFLLLALLVKCSSPGPIFYRARRLGLHGRPLQVWKFRTMYRDADDRLEKLLEENPEFGRQWRLKFKLDNDPRVTPLGRYLRKTSLDELPQLFNVLLGEMAMIGPRPIVEDEKSYYGDNYNVFSRVKPGITGLWQVSGRSDNCYDRRVTLDMYYIINWSIWLDIHILFRTLLEVVRCRGAR